MERGDWPLRLGMAWERFRDWALLQWARTAIGALILYSLLWALDKVLRAVVQYL